MASLVAVGFDAVDREKALEAALSESAVLAPIRVGDSVYLRVNSNSGDLYPYSTSPALIIAVARRLKGLGVADIRIGDRSFWGDDDTAGNLARNGIAAAAETLGTTAMVFDDSIEWVTLPADSLPHWKSPVRIPAVVHNATHVINLACVKTHFIGHITMCLKLGLGLVNAKDRRRTGNLDVHEPTRLWSQIAEVAVHVRARINILDGYEAVVSGGPTVNDIPPGAPAGWHPQTANPKTIIASSDPIAADVVGAALLRKYAPDYEVVRKLRPFDLPQIKHAMSVQGIGLTAPEDLRLVGSTSPDLEFLQAQFGTGEAD